MSDLFWAYEQDLTQVRQVLSGPQKIHPFVARACELSSSLNVPGITRFLDGAISSTRDDDSLPNIPKVTHRVRLTGDADPHFPSDYFLRKYLESVERLGPAWTHVLWVRSAEHAMILRDRLRDLGFARTDVRLLRSSPTWREAGQRIEELVGRQMYVAAADIARMVVVADHGGLYCDMGIRLNEDLTPLLTECDYAFQWGDGLFLQNSMLAARPGDPLFKLMCGVASRVSRFPLAMFDPLTAESEMWAAGGPGLSVVLYSIHDFDKDPNLHIEWTSREPRSSAELVQSSH